MSITKTFGTLLVALFAIAGTARAGLLTSDTAAMNDWQGAMSFSNTQPVAFRGLLQAEVDFAVYAPAQFENSTVLGHPTDPSGGTQYVYAYQVLSNTGGVEPISQLSVGLTGALPGDRGGNKQVANVEWLSPVGGEYQPTAANTNPLPPRQAQNVLWSFGTAMPVGDASSILIFTSPYPPQTDTASISGAGLGASAYLPSPVPEPATGFLAFVAASLVVAARSSRRWKRSS